MSLFLRKTLVVNTHKNGLGKKVSNLLWRQISFSQAFGQVVLCTKSTSNISLGHSQYLCTALGAGPGPSGWYHPCRRFHNHGVKVTVQICDYVDIVVHCYHIFAPVIDFPHQYTLWYNYKTAQSGSNGCVLSLLPYNPDFIFDSTKLDHLGPQRRNAGPLRYSC